MTEERKLVMEKLVLITKRFAGVFVFAVACFCAVLYGLGKFDFTFIRRDLPILGRSTEIIELPDMSQEDKEIENTVSQMGVGENLSGISSVDKAEESSDSEVKAPIKPENYPTAHEASEKGYVISTNPYSGNEDHVLAELILPIVMTRDQIKGKKTVLLDTPVVYEEGGEYFYAVGEGEDYRFSFETYMGYILANDKNTVAVYNSDGRELYLCGHSELMPAYVRDEEGNPLFIDDKKEYFYLDKDGRKMYSGYDGETHSIGLYFDHGASFGKSDNDLRIYDRPQEVEFIDEIDTSDYYVLSSVDPDLAYWIYILRPDYANKVARYNPRFAIALSEAKERFEEEKRLEEEKKNEMLTADTEEVKSPESETLPAESGISETETINTESFDAETSVIPETDVSAEIETETDTETELDLESDTEAETETDTETDTDTETVPADETTEPLTSANSNILIIERTLELIRYAYGAADVDYPDSLDYDYAKAYNFSEGRAAVVDDNGILRYINAAGDVVIDGTGTKMVTASRYITTEYAQPLYRHSENSKGYLYFDSGLVRVRKIERDYTFRNIIYSDSDVILYKDGSEFEIPHGYSLVSYSEGVLVLKGHNGKYGYYHKNGYWIAQPIYTEIRPFSEGLGVIGFEGGKKGVIDIDGNIVVPFAYEYITAPSCGLMTLYSYENGWKLLVKMAK